MERQLLLRLIYISKDDRHHNSQRVKKAKAGNHLIALTLVIGVLSLEMVDPVWNITRCVEDMQIYNQMSHAVSAREVVRPRCRRVADVAGGTFYK